MKIKTIGLLGGTGWSSTIGYYTLLNQLVGQKLGGYHSAKILLKSIDYHDIMSTYGEDDAHTAAILEKELVGLIALNPDCLIICCNSLHKFYDRIKENLNCKIPVFHAVELVAKHLVQNAHKKVLLLATKFTMEDGFFAMKLAKKGIDVVIPEEDERNRMQQIHGELMQNVVTPKSKEYFSQLIAKHKECSAVVLGCTEYPLVVDEGNSVLPIVNPVHLQAVAAVEYALT